MAQWPCIRDESWLSDILGNKSEVDYWQNIFERTYRGEIDTWDYQWFFANWLEGRMILVPSVNLISNIGFGEFATHTPNDKSHLANMIRKQMSFPITHPPGFFKDNQADQFTDLVYFLGITPTRARRLIQKEMRKEKFNKIVRKIPFVAKRLLCR